MPIAKEGLREIALATIILGLFAAGGGWLYWPLAIPFALAWVWVLSFFRDPRRRGTFAGGEVCSAADGTVTEIMQLDDYGPLDGPAVRIGVFLSLKFGSRTELVIPRREGTEVMVKLGDKVKAGVTGLARQPRRAAQTLAPTGRPAPQHSLPKQMVRSRS